MENKSYHLKNCESELLAKEAVKVLLEKKALDVRLFCVKESSGITDYYVNATGRSSTQVSALVGYLTEKLSEGGRDELRIEGRQANSWLLVDYSDVIVNVFDKPSREFYGFDRHLPEGSEVDISPLVAEVDAKYDINQN